MDCAGPPWVVQVTVQVQVHVPVPVPEWYNGVQVPGCIQDWSLGPAVKGCAILQFTLAANVQKHYSVDWR